MRNNDLTFLLHARIVRGIQILEQTIALRTNNLIILHSSKSVNIEIYIFNNFLNFLN